MAVYTKVTEEEIGNLISSYGDLKSLIGYSEISAGIENSNYFVDLMTVKGKARYVLTLFENVDIQELPFFTDLTTHLQVCGLPVPAPLTDDSGRAVQTIQNKPVVLVPCMPGVTIDAPNLRQCEEGGQFLAKMHQAQRGFKGTRELVRDLAWIEMQIERLIEKNIPERDLTLLNTSLERYRQYVHDLNQCPQGIVHGDLFVDNALFSDDQLTGVIDFYHACHATLLFDLAVMVNDWAWDQNEACYNEELVKKIIAAYIAHRPWTEVERAVWPRCLELAAFRFWISRLVSFYAPGYQGKALSGTPIKDPDEMKQKLIAAQAM